MRGHGWPDATGTVPQASRIDTLRTVGRVLAPLVGRGLLLRRPPVVSMAERFDLDRRAVAQLRDLRERYGDGPLRLRLPWREVAVVLSAEDVHRVLQSSPEPLLRRQRGEGARAGPVPAGRRARVGGRRPGGPPALRRGGARHPVARPPGGRRRPHQAARGDGRHPGRGGAEGDARLGRLRPWLVPHGAADHPGRRGGRRPSHHGPARSPPGARELVLPGAGEGGRPHGVPHAHRGVPRAGGARQPRRDGRGRPRDRPDAGGTAGATVAVRVRARGHGDLPRAGAPRVPPRRGGPRRASSSTRRCSTATRPASPTPTDSRPSCGRPHARPTTGR